jgi:CheY-like chemotaxis protein
MNKTEKLEQLMQESKLMFLNEERERLSKIMITLLKYRLYKREDEGLELERFFHSLNGTGSTLQFEKLSSIGKEYEEYLNTVNKSKGLSERFFLRLLDGLAQVHVSLEELFQQNNIEIKVNEKQESLNLSTTVKENVLNLDNNSRNDHLKESRLKDEGSSKKSILLVDDVSVIVHLMETHLSSMNYDVITAKDGEEGIRKCKALKPDLMLVDLMLPKVDGFEVCRRIKSDPETKDIKIIVVSSKNRKEDVLRGFDVGIDDYMTKPFSMLELKQRVEKLLRD